MPVSKKTASESDQLGSRTTQREQVGASVEFTVDGLDKDSAKQLVLRHHYSGRCPGIKYSYGLYEDSQLVGCVVYAVPASYTLCNGVCGPEYRQYVIELARLVILTPTPNAASSLVGRSLAVLPDHVVVSYADCNDHVGHVGYVYQATNWLYTGQGNAEPVYVLEADHPSGLKAGTPVSYTRRHIDKKARDLGFNWEHNSSTGPGLVRRPAVGKHRYVYITGNRRFRYRARGALRYPVLPYPKGPTRRHNSSVMVVADREVELDIPSTPPENLQPKKMRD